MISLRRHPILHFASNCVSMRSINLDTSSCQDWEDASCLGAFPNHLSHVPGGFTACLQQRLAHAGIYVQVSPLQQCVVNRNNLGIRLPDAERCNQFLLSWDVPNVHWPKTQNRDPERSPWVRKKSEELQQSLQAFNLHVFLYVHLVKFLLFAWMSQGSWHSWKLQVNILGCVTETAR